MKLIVENIAAIDSAAKQFIDNTRDKKIFAFYGQMGAGKTTFIKALCEELGVEETISSPTFSIINEYKTNNDESIYHFDFYRIKNVEEAYDFGYEDYFYSGNICFIEWPELIEDILPPNLVKVTITLDESERRIIEVEIE